MKTYIRNLPYNALLAVARGIPAHIAYNVHVLATRTKEPPPASHSGNSLDALVMCRQQRYDNGVYSRR